MEEKGSLGKLCASRQQEARVKSRGRCAEAKNLTTVPQLGSSSVGKKHRHYSRQPGWLAVGFCC